MLLDSSMWRRVLAGLVATAFLLGDADPARADVLSWLNRKIDGVLSEGKAPPDVNPEFDRYLRFLTSGKGESEQGPAGRNTAYRPRLSEALKEVIPEGGDRDTTFFYQNAYLLGVLGGQLGFRTPFRVMGHLGEGIEPSIQLLAKILDEFRKTPEAISVGRLHRCVEKAMAQVQSTHQLMVESRETLDAVMADVRGAGDMVDKLLAEEGRLQSLPVVLGVRQTLRKGADNLAESLSTLNSSVTHFRTAFAELRLELSDLDGIASLQPHLGAESRTLKERSDRIRNFVNHLSTALAAMKESGVVVCTNLGLIRLNHQSLMQVLTTLNSSPTARARIRGGWGEETEDEGGGTARRPVFGRINPRLVATVGRLASFLRDTEARRSRLEEWALGLKAFRSEPLVIDNLPDWVFEENTLPKRADRWIDLSLLPEREKDVECVIRTLERDLKPGVTREEAQRRDRDREKLDEALGDHDVRQTGPPIRSIDRMALETGSRLEVGPSSLQDGQPRSTASPAPSSYDLPSWF